MAVTVADLRRDGVAFGVAVVVHIARPNAMPPGGGLVATVASDAYAGLAVRSMDLNR